MPDLYSSIGQNALKASESSNFGTRKLSFYTIMMNPEFGLATNYTDSNSTFFRVVQAIQNGMASTIQMGPDPIRDRGSYAGGEIYWVGTPRFTLNTALIKPRAAGTVVSVDGTDIYIKGREFSNKYVYWGMPIQFAENIGDIEAGVTYYIKYWWTENNGNSRIQVSETFDRLNYNTKEPTGSSFDTNLTDTVSVAFVAGGYDPIDFTDIQPNWYPDGPEDRGFDCVMVAVAHDSDYETDCGPNGDCDFDYVFGTGIYFSIAQLLDLSGDPGDIFVLQANNEYGIFPEHFISDSWYP